MAIEAMVKASGAVPVVRAVCDQCGRDEVIACNYQHGPNHTWKPDIGQANTKMGNKGWSIVKGSLFCPSCEATRKAAKQKTPQETPMANITEIRQPTREQKRQIIDMLTSTYDVKAERYTGAETDITIADAVGGGCMFGWVAAIREDMFGPDGGNEEREALMAEITQWRDNADKLAADMHLTLREFNDARAKVADLQKRVDAVVKAAGPKVARA